MMTGNHMIRDVFCQNCNEKLGWIYEGVSPDEQNSYKLGKFVLERAQITERDDSLQTK